MYSSPFLEMVIVQTEIRSGNVQLDKMYSLYLIECSLCFLFRAILSYSELASAGAAYEEAVISLHGSSIRFFWKEIKIRV